MRILIISRGIPSQKDPMWGNFELDQAKALRDAGHKVAIMSIDTRIRFYKRDLGISQQVIDGIPLYNYFSLFPLRILSRSLHNSYMRRAAKRLFDFIQEKEGRFDVIHGHYLPNIAVAVMIKELVNIPVVGTEHWSELKRIPIKQSVRKDANEFYPKVDRLITVSNPLMEIIRREFNRESDFVGCVIDNVFGYVPKESDGIFRFIAVGSLFQIKGFDVAIKAFAEANFEKNVQFHIIGDGGERADLKKLIESLGMQNQIFLQGRKTRREIMNFMAKSSVYILSSRSENFATACMEALSAGLPAIMTKCGGPEDFVDDTNSILVEVENPSSMAAAMRYMVENIYKFDSKSISDNIKSKYSAEAISEQLNNIYNQVIK